MVRNILKRDTLFSQFSLPSARQDEAQPGEATSEPSEHHPTAEVKRSTTHPKIGESAPKSIKNAGSPGHLWGRTPQAGSGSRDYLAYSGPPDDRSYTQPSIDRG